MKTVEEYMKLPYLRTLLPVDESEGGGVLVEIPELGSYATCAWGKNEAEALKNLEQVMRDNIQMWLDEGLDIPEPKPKKRYSGAISLRVSPFMHEFLVDHAADQNMSVNGLITHCISMMMGINKRDDEIRHLFQMLDTSDVASKRSAQRKINKRRYDSKNIIELYAVGS